MADSGDAPKERHPILDLWMQARSESASLLVAFAIGTTLTRQTNFEITGALAFVKAIIFKMTVRRIHKFTMKGFKALAEA